MFKKHNIMLSGADGMIGKSLVELFKQKNELTTIGFYSQGSELTYSGDLSDREFVHHIAETCQKPAVLIFLVGLAHKKGKGAEYDLFEQVNLLTLINLIKGLDKEKKLPGKIIFASTVSVYGERSSVSSYDETIPLQPFSPYAVTKLKAEQFLINNYPGSSFIFRFAPVYSKDFMLNIERRAKIGRYFYRVGNGESKLSLCNLKNIQKAFDGVINDQVPAGIYNLSDYRDYTYNDLIEFMGGSKVLRFPRLFMKIPYLFGKITGNIFLKENSLKLLKDNTFPSTKIRQFVNMPYGLSDL